MRKTLQLNSRLIFWKQYWSYWRNVQFNTIWFIKTISIGVMFGAVFWSKGDQIQKQQDLMNLLGATYATLLFLGAICAMAVTSVVAIERTVFYRDRAAGMYSEFPYSFAQVVIESIYAAVQSIIYASILYSMMGFDWKAEKFLYFCYFFFMCFIYYPLYGMMLVALTPNQQIAAIFVSFFLNLWNLFSGFFLPRLANIFRFVISNLNESCGDS